MKSSCIFVPMEEIMNKKEKIELAKEAYLSGDKKLAKKIHDENIEMHSTGSGKYLKNLVYGGLDGIITTFAIVAGVTGANLSAKVILILGFANLFADGISMSVGDYLSSKSEQEYNLMERNRETWEMEQYPEGEIREMKELYMEKGMSQEDADSVVNTMAKYKELFIDVMMAEELEILEDYESPLGAALVTFASFLILGFVPLAATAFSSFVPLFANNTFLVSSIMTGIMLFVLGVIKSKVSGANPLKSGLEMLALGGLAAFASWMIGYLLKSIV